MKTLQIAQIGSTQQIDFSKSKLPPVLLNANIEVDYFIDSFSATNAKKRIYHGSELENYYQEKKYAALILASDEFADKVGNMSPGKFSLLKLSTSIATQHHIPLFYGVDFKFKNKKTASKELDLLRKKCEHQDAEILHLQEQNRLLSETNRQLSEQNEHLKQLQASTNYAYQVVSNAFFWKITKPFRAIADIYNRLAKKIKPLHIFDKSIRYIKRHGFRAFVRKIKMRKQSRKSIKKKDKASKQNLEQQRKKVFSKNIKISILVPLYNTPLQFLREMIDSVVAQTYSNWELCLADGSTADHAEVEKAVLAYTKKDSRIVYKKLEKNLGISENTNACIDMATGDYIALFDHDDILHPSALYEAMEMICEKNADFIYTDEATFESPNLKNIINIHYKPDFAIDNLRAVNYICHLSIFSKELLDKVGKFRSEYDGSQDHDMILRLTEQAKCIIHIPKVLYYWRAHPQSVAQNISSKSYAADAGKKAVRDSLARQGIKAELESSTILPTIYRIKYEVTTKGKVSIIIPNKDHLADLKLCIQSILERTTYPNYEIVIVDNGSTDSALFEYYETLKKHPNIQVCSLDIPFNYSKLNNFAITHATGEYYLLLNNDIEILTPNWLEEMLMYAQRDDVGAVGAMLYYPDNSVQHAGVIVGVGGVACHAFCRFDKNDTGYMGRMHFAQNLSAVTAACMMVKASVWHEVEGLDEDFKVAFNDIDLCMKIRKAGYLIVWTPYAEAYHYESKSRGLEDTPEKQARFLDEILRFQKKWHEELQQGDPYYNPNLSLNPAFMFMEE